MSEKYYIVSTEELGNLVSASRLHSDDLYNEFKELYDKASDACRSREVRFIGAADQGSSLMLWGEVKKCVRAPFSNWVDTAHNELNALAVLEGEKK